VLGNNNNHGMWPKVVSDDVLKHVYQLKNQVHVLAGQVKGKTLLPLPASADFNRCLAAGDMYISASVAGVILVYRLRTVNAQRPVGSPLKYNFAKPKPTR